MASTANNRSPSTFIALAGGVLVLNLLLLNYYYQARSDLVFQRDTARRNLAEAHGVIQKQAELSRYLTGPGASMSAEPSAVEQKLLHLFDGWEQQTGVAEPSFQRLSSTDEHGFTRLTFQISATGTIAAASGLLYCAETSEMPLRIDDAQMRPRSDGGETVQIHLTVSTLCRGKETIAAPSAPAGPDAELFGEKP